MEENTGLKTSKSMMIFENCRSIEKNKRKMRIKYGGLFEYSINF